MEQQKSEVPKTKSIMFNGTEYIHRWSENGQHEFTPAGQEDLTKWTDMLTINVYADAVDGDGLASVANKVLGSYQGHRGKVLRTDSVPATTDKPAEHLIVVVLGTSDLVEAVQARFVLVGKKGIGIISSHRVYGSKAGPQMRDWLRANGTSLEKTLMQWDPGIPVVTDLLQEPSK